MLLYMLLLPYAAFFKYSMSETSMCHNEHFESLGRVRGWVIKNSDLFKII